MYPRLVLYLLLAALMLVTCGPAGSSGARPAATEPKAASQRTLILMALQVPLNFAAKPLGGTGTGLTANIPAAIFNANLAMVDVELRPEPVLAETLPRLTTDTWRVFPDGTMETTYRLKPNLTWHDGQPLAADDFVFASKVYAIPAYGVAATVPIRSISEVLAPDPRTVVIRWSQRYVDAGILEEGLPPLPRHLLEEAHRESSVAGADSPTSLPNSSFWSSQYIGAGPYKLDVYNPGVSVEASAFDGYVLGRPKIDRVSVGGIADANTALATMLAGEAHMSFNQLWGEPAEVLAREWGTTGGTILWNPGSPRGVYFHFRPERAQPLELATDVRVRRAIAHAIDRQSIFEIAANGRGVVSDTYTLPGMDIYPLVEREVAKYPHDPRRVHQLLEEAGFVRGSDGKWTTARGVPFETTNWYTSGSAAFEHESTIMVDQLNRVGIAAVSRSFNTRSQSAMERALLPGMILAYEAAGGPARDAHRLDSNRDGIACESLPGASRTERPLAYPTPPLPPWALPGTTARCRDGTFSFSRYPTSACVGHGGVAHWYRSRIGERD